MQMVGIVGLSPEMIAESKKDRPRTVEFVSTQNVVSADAVKIGDPVFILTVPHEDHRHRRCRNYCDGNGVCDHNAADVKRDSGDVYYEERERLLVRLQLKFACVFHLRKVAERECCRALMVEATECSCQRAK
ncbi:MAG: DUF473 domain-containing protein [Methanocalculaceae archaeon]|jgi:hypothetical protein|nr:DUF473 domain-containing protein [Methanocalculaceae archaeon]